MTKDKWESATDPEDLLSWAHVPSQQRKVRLFSVACCRDLWQPHFDPLVKSAVDAAERYADALITGSVLSRWHRKVQAVFKTDPAEQQEYVITPELVAYSAACIATFADEPVGPMPTAHVALKSAAFVGGSFGSELERRYLGLVRDVYANPLRPVTFDPEWRTSTVVALAEQMYVSRDFAPMPILADALQDVGCENADMLDHCRGPGPHVRGCWVVDAVLGKV